MFKTETNPLMLMSTKHATSNVPPVGRAYNSFT